MHTLRSPPEGLASVHTFAAPAQPPHHPLDSQFDLSRHRCPMSATPHPLLQYIPEPTKKPRKPPEDRRTKRVALPVSSREYDQIRRLAQVHGCTFTAVLRQAVHSIPPPICDRPVLRELHRLSLDLKEMLRRIQKGLPVAPSVEPLLWQLLEAVNSLKGGPRDQQKDPSP